MLDALLAELWDELSLVLLGALLLIAVLVRTVRPEERERLRPVVLFALGHLALVPAAAALRAAGSGAYPAVRLASLVLAALAGVGVLSLLLFAVLLPLVRVRAPLILRDVASAVGAAVSATIAAGAGVTAVSVAGAAGVRLPSFRPRR